MFLTIAYVYIILIHIISNLDGSIRLYYKFYLKTSGDKFHESVRKITIDQWDIYFGAIFEEILFRLPLLYFENSVFFYFMIFAFSLQHWDRKRSPRNNIIELSHTLILGYLFSYIILENGFLYSVSVHLLNNFLAGIRNMIIEYRKDHLGKMILFLKEKS